MEKLVALCKRRGFIYPGSEIYGGLANTYDYGPAGTELLRNIRNLWWETFVHRRDDIVGLDASLISHHKIWEASGHVAGFADAMVDCKHCRSRFRADHIIEDWIAETTDTYLKQWGSHKQAEEEISKEIEKRKWVNLSVKDVKEAFTTGKVEGWSNEKMDEFIEKANEFIKKAPIQCPNCHHTEWTKVRKFNLLFPVQLGIVEGEQGQGYLRGETAQMIFINFRNVVDSTRLKLPFGIAQLGKSFRNEITPGNSIFRTIEFEQGELEYFFDPDTHDWQKLFESWKQFMLQFVIEKLGIQKEHLRWRTHTDEERSFYSKRTEDLEYNYPFGFKELWGLAYRTDYDLTQHMNFSKKDLTWTDPVSGKKFVPHVIEPAVGINRLLLMVLLDAYHEEEKRVVLKLHPKLAPYKVAVFPLLANKKNLVAKAKEIYKDLRQEFMTAFDDRGNIGKRYLAQDEIGTPWCVTVDFQTLENETVTVRDRDTTKQERLKIADLRAYFKQKLL